MGERGLVSTSLCTIVFPVFGTKVRVTEASGKSSKPKERKKTQSEEGRKGDQAHPLPSKKSLFANWQKLEQNWEEARTYYSSGKDVKYPSTLWIYM